MFIRILRNWLLLAARNRWLLITLHRKVDYLMANFTEFDAKLDAVAAGVDGLEAAIAALKAEVAAGHVVSQEELDSLFAKAQAIGEDIADPSDQG